MEKVIQVWQTSVADCAADRLVYVGDLSFEKHKNRRLEEFHDPIRENWGVGAYELRYPKVGGGWSSGYVTYVGEAKVIEVWRLRRSGESELPSRVFEHELPSRVFEHRVYVLLGDLPYHEHNGGLAKLHAPIRERWGGGDYAVRYPKRNSDGWSKGYTFTVAGEHEPCVPKHELVAYIDDHPDSTGGTYYVDRRPKAKEVQEVGSAQADTGSACDLEPNRKPGEPCVLCKARPVRKCDCLKPRPVVAAVSIKAEAAVATYLNVPSALPPGWDALRRTRSQLRRTLDFVRSDGVRLFRDSAGAWRLERGDMQIGVPYAFDRRDATALAWVDEHFPLADTPSDTERRAQLRKASLRALERGEGL